MNRIQAVLDIYPKITVEELTIGLCYLVKWCDRYCRAIYVAVGRDNTVGIFDFVDKGFFRPVPYVNVRKTPKVIKEIYVPTFVNWVYTSVNWIFSFY